MAAPLLLGTAVVLAAIPGQTSGAPRWHASPFGAMPAAVLMFGGAVRPVYGLGPEGSGTSDDTDDAPQQRNGTGRSNGSSCADADAASLFGNGDECGGGMAFVFAGLPALLIAFTAKRFYKTTMFLAGFGSAAYFFYVASPAMFNNTAFCCGENGTELGHIVVSLGVGLVGGVCSLLAVKLGMFAIGACLGMIVGLVGMATPLRDQPFFDNNFAYPIYYGSAALLFGLVAMVFQTFFVVLTTATAGTLIFCIGVDYFAQTGFGALMYSLLLQLEGAIKSGFKASSAETLHLKLEGKPTTWVMVGAWIVLAVAGMVVQYRTAKKRTAVDDELEEEEKLLRGRETLRRKYSQREGRGRRASRQSLRGGGGGGGRGGGGSRRGSRRGKLSINSGDIMRQNRVYMDGSDDDDRFSYIEMEEFDE